MKNKLSIGIIGVGFVGSACESFFKNYYPTNTFDINGDCNTESIKDLVLKSDIIFICLPTPMNKDGSANLDNIFNVFNEINECSNINNKYLCLKSTVPVGTCDILSNRFKHCNIVFNPEFLTERNAKQDFNNQNRIVLGGCKNSLGVVYDFYKNIFNKANIVQTDYKTAELVKYFTNCFLATKVSFANEIYDLSVKLDIDYDELINISLGDKRLGKTHFNVPGVDGLRGFSGSCFPKDLNSLINQFKNQKIESPLLNAVWSRNSKIDRKSRDWEKLKGRAVSEKL